MDGYEKNSDGQQFHQYQQNEHSPLRTKATFFWTEQKQPFFNQN
jgi:hypothetical protein